MKRTKLREAFFAETRKDPYAHMIAHLAAQMWAEGYEQALRDNGLDGQRNRKPFSGRVDEGLAFITDREAQAHALIAMAGMGKLLEGPDRGR